MFFFLFFAASLSLSAQEVESYDWNIGVTPVATVSTDTVKTVVKNSPVTSSSSNQISQELIVLGGGGYSEVSDVSWSDYAFGEGRWMFGRRFRVGPYVSYVAFNGEEIYKNPNGKFAGHEVNLGGSLDSYGAFNLKNSYYAWLNVSYRDARDSYKENCFASETKTEGVGIFFGYFVTNNRQKWLGNHKLMLSGFVPITAEVTGTWDGVEITNLKPYNKQQCRGTYELGLKRFGNKLDFEPLLHAGYGYEWGKNRQFYEIGAGFDFGIFNDWYHEVFKTKIFWRQDLTANQPSGWQAEFTMNLTQLFQGLKK